MQTTLISNEDIRNRMVKNSQEKIEKYTNVIGTDGTHDLSWFLDIFIDMHPLYEVPDITLRDLDALRPGLNRKDRNRQRMIFAGSQYDAMIQLYNEEGLNQDKSQNIKVIEELLPDFLFALADGHPANTFSEWLIDGNIHLAFDLINE